MKDVDLIDLLATRIEAALAAYPNFSLSETPVLKKMQPTQQGIPTGNQVWFELLYSIPFGWSMKSNIFVDDQNQFVDGYFNEREDQIYQTTFQVSGLFPETPGQAYKPTANDVVTHISRFLSHRATIRLWIKSGVSIYRVSKNDNMKFFDDMSQFEAFPSFDITLLHRNALDMIVPAVKRAVDYKGDIPV